MASGTDAGQPSTDLLESVIECCRAQSLLAWADEETTVHALTAAAIAATNSPGALGRAAVLAGGRLNAISTDDPAVFRREAIHFERLFGLLCRDRGPEDELVLGFASNLAAGYRALGRVAEAVALDEETLRVEERVLGPEHPDTLSSRNNLAVGYGALGRAAEAVALDEETLRVMERVLGPEHPHTLTSRNNLACGYSDLGRVAEAVALWEETLRVRERVLGAEHPDTLTSRNNLAGGYRAVGREEEAGRLESGGANPRDRAADQSP